LSISSFFHALKWSVAGELASRAIQPLVFVILARLLTPDDYGVVAAAAMIISFTQVFWEAGMSKAIIQRQGRINDAANVAFWINLFVGILIAAIIFIFSESIAATIFQDMRVTNVLRAMTLQILLGAIASVHTALLQKEMKFNKLFWVRISTVALPGLFSIPLALYGMSYWALVIGTLVGQLAQVIVLWKINLWRPHFKFNTELAKELGSFGFWVGISGLLSWFFVWVDSMFVGSYLGTHELGLYRSGGQFVTMIYGFMFSPLLPVLYSHFSGIQNDIEKLRSILLRIVRIVTFICIPLAFLLYSLADPVSAIVFGEKWKGIEFVLGVMALVQGYSWVVGANGEIYRAIGKPSYETVVNSISLVLYLIGYFLSIKHGFVIFVWTRLALAMGAALLHIFFGWLAIKLSPWYILRLVVLATAIGLIAPLVKILMDKFSNPMVEIFTVGTISVTLMAAILFLIERNNSVRDLQRLFKKSPG
jgi:O-antigen/teichoic acid export membrane protein